MTRLLIILTALAFSTLFLFYKPEGKIGFPFDDMVLNADTYIYFLFEKLIVLMLAVVIFISVKEYRLSFGLFVAIAAVDILDYLLFYGNMKVSELLTWNVIKVGLFGTTILFQYANKR